MFNKFVEVRDRDFYSANASLSAATGFSIFNLHFSGPAFSNGNAADNNNMRKGNRPPPLNLSVDTRPRSLPRISRTPAAKELTPLLTPLPEEQEFEDLPGPVVRAVRIAVDFMQIVSCMLVILMLAIFLLSYSGAATSSYGIKAFILMMALACDVGLGMWSIRFHDRPWAGWAVALRAVTASVLLGSLAASVVAGRVFPADYTYWSLPLSQSGGPVLGLVSAILGWDLVHVALSHRIVGCWLGILSWWQRVRIQRRWRCMTARGRGRGRAKSGPWWLSSRRTMAARRGWSCVS